MSSSNTLPTTSALVLSLLTSLGGSIGFARTGSIPSIAAGLSVGAIYLFSFFRLRAGEAWGEELGLLASAVLGGSSIPRAIKTGKVVPAGLSVLATYGAIVFALAYREKRA
ncbi:transmembrane 14C domain protein [Penicillium waksmanii]|uniref:transmembrane 14C domain protein n=1 Tax=Penicillium waksmanii TaxID=69791 RepID=UPI00254803ED|nr:transmembrane 14C domain protein [Penicillium waksmanii]KAJ6000655.1 transmembrane 14C domain protein [Penicillium waksmanii]